MIPFEYILLISSLLILISIALWKVSENLGLPSLVLFLLVGMAAGSDGLGKIYFEDIYTSQAIGIVALIFILFSGGMDTRWKSVKPILWSAVSLSTFGVLITTLVIGFSVHYLLHYGLTESLLLGAIISSTDAAAVFSVLRAKNTRLKGNIKPLLELESGSNDPIAIILTIVFIQALQTNEASVAGIIFYLLLQLIIGAVIGYLSGRLMILIINQINFSFSALYPVFAITFAILIYSAASALHGSGILAAYIAAIVVGNHEFIQKKSMMRYFEGLAVLSQIITFLALGLLVYPSRLIPIAGTGLIISIILIFAARPVGVFLALIFSKFKLNEKVFISWVGLRGAVPIILATFPLTAGLSSGSEIFNIVFFITLVSALLQGSTIPAAAKILRVEEKAKPDIKMPIELTYDVNTKNQLIDFIIPYNSALKGKRLAQLDLPPESLITVICRNEEYIVPTGSSTLEEGDTLLVLVNNENAEEVKRILNRVKKKDG